MPLPSTAKFLDVIAKLQDLTGITQIPDLKEALQSRGINLTGNETMVDLVQIVKDNNFNNTADATATAGNVLSGKTAYVKGVKVTGAMPNNGEVTINPGAADQAIPAGYHNGSGVVKGVTIPTQYLVEGNSVAGQAGTLKDYSRAKLTAESPNKFIDAVGTAPRVTQNSIIVRPQTGYYDDGVNIGNEGSIRITDPNFKAANIIEGITMFGVTGKGIKAYNFQSTVDSVNNSTWFVAKDGSNVSGAYVNANFGGLTFDPDFVVLRINDNDPYATICVKYSTGGYYLAKGNTAYDFVSSSAARMSKDRIYLPVDSMGTRYQIICGKLLSS